MRRWKNIGSTRRGRMEIEEEEEEGEEEEEAFVDGSEDLNGFSRHSRRSLRSGLGFGRRSEPLHVWD